MSSLEHGLHVYHPPENEKEKERWRETASGEECEKRDKEHVSNAAVHLKTLSVFSHIQLLFAYIL